MTALGSILIADDEDTFRQSTAYLFRQRGYQCDCAADGQEALGLFAENHYDLLVADIHMPGNDDLGLIRRAQATTGGVPVILVTGYPCLETATRSVPLPVVAYLTKPVDFEELCSNVEGVMGQSRTKRLAERTMETMEVTVRELHAVTQDLGGSTELGRRAHLASNLELTATRLAECYQAVHRLHASLMGGEMAVDPCRELKCSRLKLLEGAVREGIAAIERTRHSFKSKELGALRRHLARVLEQPK